MVHICGHFKEGIPNAAGKSQKSERFMGDLRKSRSSGLTGSGLRGPSKVEK